MSYGSRSYGSSAYASRSGTLVNVVDFIKKGITLLTTKLGRTILKTRDMLVKITTIESVTDLKSKQSSVELTTKNNITIVE